MPTPHYAPGKEEMVEEMEEEEETEGEEEGLEYATDILREGPTRLRQALGVVRLCCQLRAVHQLRGTPILRITRLFVQRNWRLVSRRSWKRLRRIS